MKANVKPCNVLRGSMFYKALQGIKVVEYGNLVSAPFCAKILADLGAEVIKIEQPYCGDDSRRLEPFLEDFRGQRIVACFCTLT